MTDLHDPDRLSALIVKSTATQMASAQVLGQAYDLLQVAHAAIERARSLQRGHETMLRDNDGSPATHVAPTIERRGGAQMSTRRSAGPDADPRISLVDASQIYSSDA